MQAVILAAGRGKRMGKLTRTTTKPMLKIKGKPILEHKLNALPKKIKEIVLIVGYHSADVMAYFKRYFGGRRIIYVFQTNLNGTAGALHLAKSILREKFLVLMGDDLYSKKDLANLLKNDLAVLVHEVEDVGRFGFVKVNSRKHLVDVLEKPKKIKKGLANAGAYVLNSKFFEYEMVSVGGGEFGLPQTLAKMGKEHKIKVEKASLWQPITDAEDLLKAEQNLGKFL